MWRRLFGEKNGGKRLCVQTITYTRKMPLEKWGNAEFILTARVLAGQYPEDVMDALIRLARRKLEEVKCEEVGQ